MSKTISNELLPIRLNGEPSIFRGCSLSELMGLAAIGTIIWVPFWIVVCAVLGIVMMGVGIGLLSIIAWVFLGGTILQQVKRGRPMGYYSLKLRLMLADLGVCKAPFLRDSRIWSVGRTL
jgi:conjugative transfer region protein (TIGR03750 family)